MQKATRQYTKNHNISLVLKTIYHHESISRADLARQTGLTRTTVSDIVNTLIGDGLVHEIGVGESIGGKPPVLLALNENARAILCLDLSQRGFAGALINLRGEVLARVDAEGKYQNREAAYQRVLMILNTLLKDNQLPILGIGIGTPGFVNPNEGTIRQAVRLDWEEFPIVTALEQEFKLPVHIANDGHISALAEYTYGGWADVPNLVVIKSSEGIGSGIVLDGKIHYGDGFTAGEIGHLKVGDNGIRCECGNIGCLETEAGSIALRKRAREVYESDQSWLPAGVDKCGITLEHIRQAYLAEHPAITAMVNQSARAIGVVLASLIGVLDVHQVVLSGDLVDFGDRLTEIIHQEANKNALYNMVSNTRFERSSLGVDHVLLGASALVMSKELGLP